MLDRELEYRNIWMRNNILIFHTHLHIYVHPILNGNNSHTIVYRRYLFLVRVYIILFHLCDIHVHV